MWYQSSPIKDMARDRHDGLCYIGFEQVVRQGDGGDEQKGGRRAANCTETSADVMRVAGPG